MRNKAIFIFTLLFLFSKSEGQSALSFINNATIKFNFGYGGGKLSDSSYYKPSKYVVHVKLTKEERNKAQALDNKDWIELLNNVETDWAANLILYDLFRKDAIDFFAINNLCRSSWVYLFKNDDVAYWKKTLR